MKEIIKSLEEIRNTCRAHFDTQEGCKECPLGTSDGMCQIIMQKIERRPKGEWIDKGDYADCSICGAHSGVQYDGVQPEPLKTKYCPNCGAYMVTDGQNVNFSINMIAL